MGPFRAVGSAYRNILNFSGRARRAEYWWFMVYSFVAIIGSITWLVMQVVDVESLMAMADSPEKLQQFAAPTPQDLAMVTGYWWAGYVVLIVLPGLSVTIRRLHDTSRSGFWYFIQLVPLIGPIWFLILMCLPGTHGTNHYGPDSVPNRKRKPPVHPAFQMERTKTEQRDFEVQRKEEIAAYYRARVVPVIEQTKAARRSVPKPDLFVSS